MWVWSLSLQGAVRPAGGAHSPLWLGCCCWSLRTQEFRWEPEKLVPWGSSLLFPREFFPGKCQRQFGTIGNSFLSQGTPRLQGSEAPSLPCSLHSQLLASRKLKWGGTRVNELRTTLFQSPCDGTTLSPVTHPCTYLRQYRQVWGCGSSMPSSSTVPHMSCGDGFTLQGSTSQSGTEETQGAGEGQGIRHVTFI